VIGLLPLLLALAPQDELTLASDDYRAGNHRSAKAHLRRALERDPASAYAKEFLATLYMLDGNVEAALKYWNRAGKPRIEDVRTIPDPAPIAPSLLDRAYAFSPANVLSLEDYRFTQARLHGLGGLRSRIDLVPRPEKDFDIEVVLVEPATMARRLAWMRSLPFLAVNLDFWNLRRSAVNWTNLVRFDPNKRRLLSTVTAPLLGDPGRQIRLYVDTRRERWNIGANDVPFRKTAAGAAIEFLPHSRVRWSTGVEVASQRFDPGIASRNGSTLRYRLGAMASVLNMPERRLTVEAGGHTDLGRLFGREGGRYSRTEAVADTRWFPKARGSDYETRVQFRAGTASGALPLDEMFQVGVERDTSLWLRGHAGTADGRKGSGLIGRRYGLAHLECFKSIYDGGFLAVQAGPFTDVARVRDALGRGIEGTGFVDPGAQVRIRILGAAAVRLSYSRGVFYAAVERLTQH